MTRFARTLPPAAVPITGRDLLGGVCGMTRGTTELERRRQEFMRYFGMRHCFFVSSGQAALALILTALKQLRPQRDQVLIPALTCYSVPAAIVAAGLHPVLCDIDPATLDFDFAKLAPLLDNPRLLCVLPTHLFGLPADVRRLRSLVAQREVAVVEDAAQALGAEWYGCRLGAMADVSFFSLARGKALSAVQGGVILTRDGELGARLDALVAALPPSAWGETLRLIAYALVLSLFQRPALFWLPAALPFLHLGTTRFEPEFPVRRLTPFQAGLLRGWPRKLACLRRVRRANTRFWIRSLPEAGLVPVRPDDGLPDLVRFPLKIAGSGRCRRVLAEGLRRGMGLAPTYPDAICAIPELRRRYALPECPAARRVARQLITLPVHGFVTAADRERILDLVANVAFGSEALEARAGRESMVLDKKAAGCGPSC